MSVNRFTTVMGPVHTSSDTHPSTIDPPSYVTNQTNKVQYKDALLTWIDIIRSFAKFDHKSQARLDMVGLIIYMSCDADTKAKLRAAETGGILNLKGEIDDPDRSHLISQILSTIAAESASEKIQREVTMLNNIHQCNRHKNETPETFANRFDAKVAEYVHQRSDKHSSNDQQWALLMLQNANLTPDTLNSITFQLTTGAAMRKNPVSPTTFSIQGTTLNDLTKAYKQIEASTEQAVRETALANMGKAIQEINTVVEAQPTEEVPTITFAEAVSVLRQVKVTTDQIAESTTMLAKRGADNNDTPFSRKKSRIDQIKSNTKCLACGRVGHWFKDNPRCLRIMDNRNPSQNVNRNNDESDKPNGNTFFRPRGQ